MPNIERIRDLADRIEAMPHAINNPDMHEQSFIMSNWKTITVCGTACCIAGWAVEFFGDDEAKTLAEDNDWQAAGAKVLGISILDAAWLFMGLFAERGTELHEITPAQAAAALRTFLPVEGEVV